MNWKTFLALLARDAHVARRNFVPLLLQTFLQPMMFVFIFGRVMVIERLHARRLQEPALARDHGDQHGVHGRLGGRDAADRRISVHARDRRPPARAD